MCLMSLLSWKSFQIFLAWAFSRPAACLFFQIVRQMFHRTEVAVDTFLHIGEVMMEVDIPLRAVQP